MDQMWVRCTQKDKYKIESVPWVNIKQHKSVFMGNLVYRIKSIQFKTEIPIYSVI